MYREIYQISTQISMFMRYLIVWNILSRENINSLSKYFLIFRVVHYLIRLWIIIHQKININKRCCLPCLSSMFNKLACKIRSVESQLKVESAKSVERIWIYPHFVSHVSNFLTEQWLPEFPIHVYMPLPSKLFLNM